MKKSDQDFTRQEEDLSAPEFDMEERQDQHDFGNWPEAFGFVFTLFVCWLMFAFTG